MRILPNIFVIAVTLVAEVQPLHAQSATSPASVIVQQDRANLDRWTQLTKSGKQQQVIDECTAALNGNIDPAWKIEIHFVRALAGITMKSPQASAFVDAFIDSAPKDERGGELLFRLAKAQTNRTLQTQYFNRAVQQYPETYWATMSQGAIHQAEGIGKPFNLDFTDAITGKPVSVQKDFKGKIVVIDFWATWCSDCAAELPQMMMVYAKYENRGVEFVGVSLDESESLGGLTKLKDYVKAKRIVWPQYYQGDKFNSQFSANWGVSSTPTIFIIDKEGKLFATSANGGNLDQLLDEMLGHQKTD